MGKIGSFPVAVATTFVFGTCASAQSVITPKRIHVTWGEKVPAAAQTIKAGTSVTDLFRELGAPFATYSVGDKVIYRWGRGSIEGDAAKVVRQHNELLVTADKNGKVLETSYRPKFQQAGPADIVMSESPH